MAGVRWRVLLLAALCAGCTQAPTAVHRAPAGSAPAPGSSSAGSNPAGTSPARTSPARTSPARTKSVHVTPSPSTAGQAPLSAGARAAGLLDVRTIVPDAVVDLRYATSNNFVGTPLYPPDARCLVHESMAAGLRTAARHLRSQGYVLVFWDCYRPHPVQVRMFQIVPNPAWVARPRSSARSHEAGRSVDVTLARASTAFGCPSADRSHGHCLLDMGTGFDDFTLRAHAFATSGVSALARSNRAVLRAAMNSGGIVVYSGEWWHFDGPGALVGRPFLDAPVD